MTDFVATKARFHLPKGVIYLDGNSLGPLPEGAMHRAQQTIESEWGEMLIRAWNFLAGWMDQPRRVGDKIVPLIGAEPGTVVMGDTLSIKMYQALAAALAMRPDRKIVLSDTGNFPTRPLHGEGSYRLAGSWPRSQDGGAQAVEDAIDESVAALMLTHIDYGSGRVHDMARLTEKAHAAGALAIWDLAHSAGATPVDLAGCRADFAAGCTYKYLNGGPGAPAFIYVRPDHIDKAQPALSGWLGHEAPFDFALDYCPARGIERMRVGTPPVVQLSILEAALEIWDGIVWRRFAPVRSNSPNSSFEKVEARCPMLALASPRDPAMRGSQVSFRFEHGYAAMQALIARGVIGDFRAPDRMRFGIAPLYIDEGDVRRAVDILARVLADRAWDRPEYRRREAIT